MTLTFLTDVSALTALSTHRDRSIRKTWIVLCRDLSCVNIEAFSVLKQTFFLFFFNCHWKVCFVCWTESLLMECNNTDVTLKDFYFCYWTKLLPLLLYRRDILSKSPFLCPPKTWNNVPYSPLKTAGCRLPLLQSTVLWVMNERINYCPQQCEALKSTEVGRHLAVETVQQGSEQ